MRLTEYRRVSTRGQARDGYGLKAQARDNRAWAAANGHRIAFVREDDGLSGTLPPAERPGLRAALDTLNGPGGSQGLLVARLDRLAREVTVQEAILAAVWATGHAVFTADGGEVLRDDPDDPMRTAMRQMSGVFAGLDRRLIVKRLRDGRRVKAAEGKKATGAYAYGYRGEGKGRDRDAAPDPAEQATVARILELRAAGKSYREICATLETEGHRPRKAAHWSAMTVRQIWVRETGQQ